MKPILPFQRIGACVLLKLEVPLLILVPLVLVACAYFQIEQAAVLTLLVVVLALALFFASFETARPSLRHLMPITVLAALAAAGRIIFAPFPDFKPVSAIAIMAGVVFGRRSGFMVGALAALVSNFFFGQGPWTPWQMYAWGLVGYLAGVLSDHGLFRWRTPLYIYGFLSAFLYGFLLNTWYVIGFVQPFTFESVALAYLAGISFDTVHALATLIFLAALFEPWRKKLIRIKQKYGLDPGETIP